VVPPRFQAEDAQDDGQGKEGLGAGDGTRNAGFGLPAGRRLPSSRIAEARSSASRRRTTAARTRACISQRALDASAS
jgi:hypothetical protein